MTKAGLTSRIQHSLRRILADGPCSRADGDGAVQRSSDRRTLRDPRYQRELVRAGFVVVPFLTDAALGELRDLHAVLGPAPDDPQVALNWTFHSESMQHKRAVRDAVLPLLGNQLESLLEDHVAYLTTFITKWPGPDSGFAPHQDPTLVDERRFRGVTVWAPLGPTGIIDGDDNGMLRFVPGSHRFSDALRVSDVDRSPLKDHQDDIISHYGWGVETSPGEAIVFDNRTIHFSLPNRTETPRVVISFGVRPREAACVLLREHGDTGEMFEIHDDFYTDVLPARQHLWVPPTEAVARFAAVHPSWSSSEFDDLCRSAPTPVRGQPLGADDTAAWQDPGIFCARCGGTEGLVEVERSSHNNAQLLCAGCTDRLRGSRR